MHKICIVIICSFCITGLKALSLDDIEKYTEEFYFLTSEIKKIPKRNNPSNTEKINQEIKMTNNLWFFPTNENKAKYNDTLELKLSGIQKTPKEELNDEIDLDELEKKLKE